MKRILLTLLFLAGFCYIPPAAAQTSVNGRIVVGLAATKPATCVAGDTFIASDTPYMYVCGPANTWTPLLFGGLAATQVAFGSATNTIAGDANFTWNNTAKSLSVTNSGLSGIAPIYALALGVTVNEAGIVAQCQQLANAFCEAGQFVASDSGAGPIGSVIGIAVVPSHQAVGTLGTLTGIEVTSSVVGGAGAITTSRGIHVGGVSFLTGTTPVTQNGIIIDDQCAGSFSAPTCIGLNIAAQSNSGVGASINGLLNATAGGAFSGTFSHSGAETFANLNSVLVVGSATGQYAHLQTAHDALPSGGGTIVITPLYIDTETSTVNVTKNNVSVLCQNQAHFGDTADTEVVFNHTSVGINVTGQNFGMNGCHLKIGTNSTRVGVPMIDSNTTVGGRLSNLFVSGQSGSPDNGIFFRSKDTSFRQGLWQLDNIFNRDGNTWTSIITVAIASASLTGAYYKFTDIVNSYSEKYTDAAIVLDGTIDTVEMERISTGNTQTNGHNIWARNTVSASGLGYPRWIHCNNCYLEAGGNIGGVSLQIDSGRDIDYQGYIASSANCVNATNSFLGVNIHDVAFTNIFGTCIAVTGGTGTTIHHNNFSDLQQGDITYSGGGGILIDGNVFRNDSQQTTNTYDTITLAAGTGTASIMNNIWINAGTPKPRYGINFLGNFNSSNVSGNIYAGVTFGTAFLNPPGNNLNISVIGQDSTVTNKMSGPIQMFGSTSGSITHAAPAVAGSNTITDPAATGTTSLAVVEYCGATTGATQACAKTVQTLPIIVWGDVTLNTATSQSITTLPFTDALYSCTGSDLTTAAGVVSFNTYASASVTIVETGGVNTDHLRYFCIGH